MFKIDVIRRANLQQNSQTHTIEKIRSKYYQVHYIRNLDKGYYVPKFNVE